MGRVVVGRTWGQEGGRRRWDGDGYGWGREWRL